MGDWPPLLQHGLRIALRRFRKYRRTVALPIDLVCLRKIAQSLTVCLAMKTSPPTAVAAVSQDVGRVPESSLVVAGFSALWAVCTYLRPPGGGGAYGRAFLGNPNGAPAKNLTLLGTDGEASRLDHRGIALILLALAGTVISIRTATWREIGKFVFDPQNNDIQRVTIDEQE